MRDSCAALVIDEHHPARRTIEQSRTLQEYLDAPSSDRLTVGDVRFRKEPDEEEDEEEEDKKGEDEDEEGDEDDDQNGGYSV